MKQITLNLVSRVIPGLNSIVEHSGIQTALSTLRSIIKQKDGGNPSPVFIHGGPGSGKTVLIRSFFNSFKASHNYPDEATFLIEPQIDSSRFPDLEKLDLAATETNLAIKLLAIDDFHRISGDDSFSFWSLYNKLNRNDGLIVITSREHPSEMFQGNDHLRSRLLSGLVIRIEPPTDTERPLILEQMAIERGFRISPEACNYLLRRKSRNLKELDRILGLIDARSLETKRRITVPFIKELELQEFI